MSFSARPTVQPWRRANLKRQFEIILAVLIPLPLTMLFALLSNFDVNLALIAVFLPLQLIAAGLVGLRAYGKRGIGDAVLVVVTIFFSTFVLVLLLSVLFSVIVEGGRAISWQFFSQNNVYVSPTTSLEYGGVGHAILGTLMVVGLTTLAAVPLGIAMAVYLTQSQSKTRNLVRTFTQALSGLPSVVSGLFILTIIEATQMGRSGFTGSLALFPLMLPTVARVAEEALRLVPVDLRYAALALGAPNYRAFFQVILPAAKSGLMTALLLGLARVVGETAPLILTMNPNSSTSLNPFDGGMTTLPTYVYNYLASSYQTSQARAWGAALVLLMLVGVLFGLARILSKSKTTKKKASK
jgi:phosphate transport system permease protein